MNLRPNDGVDRGSPVFDIPRLGEPCYEDYLCSYELYMHRFKVATSVYFFCTLH